MTNSVFRQFDIQVSNTPDGSTRSIIMTSSTEGEFGPMLVHCVFEIDGEYIGQSVRESSGASFAEIFDFRVQEMQYFISVIVPLCKP